MAPAYRAFVFEHKDNVEVHIDVMLDVTEQPELLVQQALSPLVISLEKMNRNPPKVFVCHASEDKTSARAIADAMKQMGAIVWLDEWEIKVGESIVQKVSAGLEASSYLVLLVSCSSVKKPWVQRELSASLMRQLSDRSVVVLPVRLDATAPPVIIADLKYADATTDFSSALKQLYEAIFPE